MMMRALSALLAFWLALPCVAQADDARPLFIGRVDASVPGHVRLGWPGSEILLHFNGTTLAVTLNDWGQNSFVLDLDGKLSRLNLQPGEHTYTLAEGLAPGDHWARLIRRTEGFVGPTTYLGATTDRLFLSPGEPSKRQMLFIGDSITAAYGVEGSDTSCHYTTDTQNAYLSYASVAARALGADARIFAVSGRGVVRNYDNSATDTMPELWDRVMPLEPAKAEDKGYIPGVIVVHLGTNDFGHGNPPSQDEFAAAYAKLLASLRGRYPNALIYGAIGPMLMPEDVKAASAAVEAGIAKRVADGDTRVGFLLFVPGGQDELGCDWHPGVRGAARMAATLVERVTHDLKWQSASASPASGIEWHRESASGAAAGHSPATTPGNTTRKIAPDF